MKTSGPVAIFLPTLKGGGAERMMIHLAAALAKRGHRVDLVVGRPVGRYFGQVPESVRLVILESATVSVREQVAKNTEVLEMASRTAVGGALSVIRLPRHGRWLMSLFFSRYGRRMLRMIPALTEYLRREQPVAVLSALTRANVVAVVAGLLSGGFAQIVVSERNHLSKASANADQRFVSRRALARRFYPLADRCTCVSEGVADDLSGLIDLPRSKIAAVKNPVVTDALMAQAAEPVEHPWFEPRAAPVILAAGRLTVQKDFTTLLKAVARVRKSRPIKLVLLGSGPERASLGDLAKELGIGDVVDFRGFVENPYAYMANASLFALSSAWEGSPNVLVEAMACGCPVVSTDCPSGPAEILVDDSYGKLVPVGDGDALCGAIIELLDNPTKPELLRERAAEYSSAASAEQHERILGIAAPADRSGTA